MLVDYYRKAGVPEGVVRIAQGGPETGRLSCLRCGIGSVSKRARSNPIYRSGLAL